MYPVFVSPQRKKDWQSLTCSTRRSHQDSLDQKSLVVLMRCVCVMCVCDVCAGAAPCGVSPMGLVQYTVQYTYTCSPQGGDDEDVTKFEKQLFR